MQCRIGESNARRTTATGGAPLEDAGASSVVPVRFGMKLDGPVVRTAPPGDRRAIGDRSRPVRNLREGTFALGSMDEWNRTAGGPTADPVVAGVRTKQV